MDANVDMIYDVKRKMLTKYPRFQYASLLIAYKNVFYNHIKDTKESKKLKEDTFPKKKLKNICK